MLLGPNGTGKSTLGNTLLGNPKYNVTRGEIWFQGKNITEEPVNERAKMGLFLSFQNPLEVPGVTLSSFIRSAVELKTGKRMRLFEFRKELEKAMEVYRNNQCVVISDEIWSDIILEGNQHIPLASVSEDAKNRTISFYAPSKTFSLAGLVGSYHIIYNKYLRDLVRASSSKCHYNSMNVISMHALVGAYSKEGEVW